MTICSPSHEEDRSFAHLKRSCCRGALRVTAGAASLPAPGTRRTSLSSQLLEDAGLAVHLQRGGPQRRQRVARPAPSLGAPRQPRELLPASVWLRAGKQGAEGPQGPGRASRDLARHLGSGPHPCCLRLGRRRSCLQLGTPAPTALGLSGTSRTAARTHSTASQSGSPAASRRRGSRQRTLGPRATCPIGTNHDRQRDCGGTWPTWTNQDSFLKRPQGHVPCLDQSTLAKQLLVMCP